MRILIHDYAGHPFQVDLSRRLAERGHDVVHAWFALDIGPKGVMTHDPSGGAGPAFVPLGADIDYSKTDFRKRRAGDLAYGRAFGDLISSGGFDVVISGNTPTEAQEIGLAAARAAGVPFVYWCQDFYSIAVSRLLARRLPGAGHAIGAWYRFLERRQMRRSAHVVHITEAFRAQTDRWGIPAGKVSVIPNWGALDEIPPRPRDNDWARAQGLGPGPRHLYSGTLALKHNPGLLAALAGRVSRDGSGGEVVLVSAGAGADRLAAQVVPGLRILPLQPFEAFADVLGAADVLLCVIERDAGAFSVPSKVLSYLCAGRPIVLAAPAENLAARIVRDTGAGRVVDPEDTEGFVAAARAFAADPDSARRAGDAGRAYALANFDLERVTDRFETLLRDVATGPAPSGRSRP